MGASLSLFTGLRHCIRTAALDRRDIGRLVALMPRSSGALSAGNLFLRKQLALFQEPKVKPSSGRQPRIRSVLGPFASAPCAQLRMHRSPETGDLFCH
jgi:hypothetical protein